MTPFLLTAALVASGPVVIVPWAGHLEHADGVAVDDTVSAAFTVTDAATDEVLLQSFEPTLAVVGGDFVVDVPVPALEAGAGVALLVVIVNGDAFPPVRVTATAPVVAFADVAAAADTADDASALDGLSDPVTLAALVDDAGDGARVAFENVTGAPADFVDGDDGLTFSPDASFGFSGGVLTLLPRGVSAAHLGSLAGADLAVASVNATHIAANTLTAADITGTLPLSTVVPDAFGIEAFTTASTAVEVFEVNVDRCAAPRGTLQVDATCTFDGVPGCSTTVGNTTVDGYFDCEGICRAVPLTSCPLPTAGFLVFP
jgi:hypothetical protein